MDFPEVGSSPARAEVVARASALYFALQGFGGMAWWILLFLQPQTRVWFMATGAPESTLLAFAIPDLTLYVGASLVAAVGLWTGRSWAWPAVCLHTGAALYAAAYCLGLWCLDSRVWLPAVMMLPSLIVTPLIVCCTRPRGDRT